jgi:hypothetical protein
MLNDKSQMSNLNFGFCHLDFDIWNLDPFNVSLEENGTAFPMPSLSS